MAAPLQYTAPNGLASRVSRRPIIVAVTVVLAFVCLFSMFRYSGDISVPSLHEPSPSEAASDALLDHDGEEEAKVEVPLSEQDQALEKQCPGRAEVVSFDTWETAQTKYKNLMDDKFTIAIQTYRRPESLNQTIAYYTETKIPSLHEIVIIWNDIEATPPPDFTGTNGVAVRHRVSRRNSLNEKLFNHPDYATQAVLLSDDDVHYPPADLDFIFQSWRRYGHRRLTGAFARCTRKDKKGRPAYGMCRKDASDYDMVLTGLAFVDVALLDYYSSDDPLMTKIRNYVDDVFNCEDIALNFVASMLSCEGPLQVSGFDDPINNNPAAGISRTPGHGKKRSQCLKDFKKWMGFWPLKKTQERIIHGVLPG